MIGHRSRTTDSLPSALRWRWTGVHSMSSTWMKVGSLMTDGSLLAGVDHHAGAARP